MRSSAIQACRPLRLTSPRLQCLVQPAFSASVATTSSSTASSSTPTPKPAYKPKARVVLAPSKKGPRAPQPHPDSPKRNGIMEPQAALSPAPSAEEIDVASAKQIPTQATSPSAFIAALASSPTINGNGPVSGLDDNSNPIDWASSFHGLSTSPFSAESAAILQAPINPDDIEVKPDGIIYLPEIKYRRILNAAFGPGGWGLAPRGELIVGEKVVTREYALVVNGRFVGQARGECSYFSEDTIPTAGEGCKSNALMRCCKDLGIASELWDPRFIRGFKKEHGHEVWVEHVVSKKRRQIWKRKDCDPAYPYTTVTR